MQTIQENIGFLKPQCLESGLNLVNVQIWKTWDVEKVRNNYRICDYHFALEYMVGVQHFSISGLVTGAVPTLNSSSYVELAQPWSKAVDLRTAVERLMAKITALEFEAVHETNYNRGYYTEEECNALAKKYEKGVALCRSYLVDILL
ncbi:hypothetical protein FQR65_LT18214 [Abscondita terminalis]|nr:hypothetical protein FQR65_LT18214 [Abscondita terminalis]